MVIFMRFKNFIFKYAGIPGEPSGFEGPMLYLAVIVTLIVGFVTTLIADPNLGLRTPLLLVLVFFLLKFIAGAGHGDWIIYGPVKVVIAASIYFIGMSAINNGWWYFWGVVALAFLISGVIDLIACSYDWLDRKNGKKPRFDDSL